MDWTEREDGSLAAETSVAVYELTPIGGQWQVWIHMKRDIDVLRTGDRYCGGEYPTVQDAMAAADQWDADVHH